MSAGSPPPAVAVGVNASPAGAASRPGTGSIGRPSAASLLSPMGELLLSPPHASFHSSSLQRTPGSGNASGGSSASGSAGGTPSASGSAVSRLIGQYERPQSAVAAAAGPPLTPRSKSVSSPLRGGIPLPGVAGGPPAAADRRPSAPAHMMISLPRTGGGGAASSAAAGSGTSSGATSPVAPVTPAFPASIQVTPAPGTASAAGHAHTYSTPVVASSTPTTSAAAAASSPAPAPHAHSYGGGGGGGNSSNGLAGMMSPLARARASAAGSFGGNGPFPSSPLSPRTPRGGHARKRTMDDTGVEEVEAYLRAPLNSSSGSSGVGSAIGAAAGPLSPRRSMAAAFSAAAAGPVALRKRDAAMNSLMSPKGTDGAGLLSPSASPTAAQIAARHKLQSYRTLPLNLPSSNVLAAAAAFAAAEEAKNNEASRGPGGGSGARRTPTLALSVLSPPSSRPIGAAANGSGGAANHSASPVAHALSPSSSSGALSPSTAGSGAGTGAASSSSGRRLPPGVLSPTHFSYWEKRNIWVQREQEEMRAKVNLKKVLRKINASNMLILGEPLAQAQAIKQRAQQEQIQARSKSLISTGTAAGSRSPLHTGMGTATGRGSVASAANSGTTSPLSPGSPSLYSSPTPPNFPAALVQGAAAVAAVRNSVSSPTRGSVHGSLSPVPPTPTSAPQPVVTISELSAAASTLHLTAQLGDVGLVKLLTNHLSAMEVAECKFTSAPQIMWALKALTTTGEDEGSVGQQQGNEQLGSPTGQPLATPSLQRDASFQRKSAVERILAEQSFAPSVVSYIRQHALAPSRGPPPPPPQPHAPFSPAGAGAGATGGIAHLSSPTHGSSLSTPTLALNMLSTNLASPRKSPTQAKSPGAAAGAAAANSSLAAGASTAAASSSALPTSTRALPASSSSGGGGSGSSTRSNSLQTELDHEWSRRHIPRMRRGPSLPSGAGGAGGALGSRADQLRAAVDAKLKEDTEEMDERRAALVDKLLRMDIWADRSKLDRASVESSLHASKFDLLRFTFELTELAEMQQRNVRFESAGQAMASLRVLYEKWTPDTLAKLYEAQRIAPHVQAYLEARRNEIAHSREASTLVVPQPPRVLSPSSSSSAAAQGALSARGGPPSNTAASSAAAAAAVAAAAAAAAASPALSHHRAISLVELVEMLSSGNLLASSGSSPVPDGDGSAPPPAKCTVEHVAWLLSSCGLDVNEVSIDDLIQMQQHPSLVRAFGSAREVVAALAILYTHCDEAEVETQGIKAGLDRKVIQYLQQQQRVSSSSSSAAAAASLADGVGGGLLSSRNASSSMVSSDGASSLMHHVVLELPLQHTQGGGFKCSRLARAKKVKTMRARIIEFQLQHVEAEELEEIQEESAPGPGGRRELPAPKFALTLSERDVLERRNRRFHPLGGLPLSVLCMALNNPPATRLIAPETLPLSQGDLAQLVVEMALQLGEGDCEVDLLDLELLARELLPPEGSSSDAPAPFATPKQCLMALQLLNVDCTSLEEFEASCSRAGFSPRVTALLKEHSASGVSARVLAQAELVDAPAAKYCILEEAVQAQEELWEEEDMEGEFSIEEGGSSSGMADVAEGTERSSASTAVSPTQRYTAMELRFQDEGVDEWAALQAQPPLTPAELSSRLQQSSLLQAAADPSSANAHTVAHLVSSMALPLGLLDRELLWSDLASMEQQGGLKFKHARHLLTALHLLQDESITNEERMYAECEAQHFSPSVTTFLLQLHRSPARAERLAMIRAQRRLANASRGRNAQQQQRAIAQPSSAMVLQGQIREEGDEWKEETVTVSAKALARHVHQVHLLDLDGSSSSDGMLVEEQQFQELLLSHSSSLDGLPQSVLEEDVSSLARAGMKFPSAKQLVQVLDLIHSAEEEVGLDEIVVAMPESKGAASAVPKHAQFVLEYRRSSRELGRNARVAVEHGNSQQRKKALKAKPSSARLVTEAEFELTEEEVDGSVPIEDLPPPKQRARRVARLARALRSSSLLPAECVVDASGVEQSCVELDFTLDEGHFEALERLQALSAQDGSQSQVAPPAAQSLRHVVMALQLLDESEALELDAVNLEADVAARAAKLPEPLAQHVLLLTRKNKRLKEHAATRRSQAKAKAQAQAASVPVPQQQQGISFEQLEMEFSELDGGDEQSADGTVSSSSASRASRAAALRSCCVEMELDLSSVDLDEVRVLTSSRAFKKLRTPRQAVQLLSLMRFDCAGALTRDKVDLELQRREAAAAAAGGAPKSSAAARRDTVQLLFELEEELQEEEEMGPRDDASTHPRRVSRLPPPLPAPVSTLVNSASHSTSNEVSPEGVLSPAPPPFPTRLLQGNPAGDAADAARASALSPPLPAYPFSAASSAPNASSSPSPPMVQFVRAVSETSNVVSGDGAHLRFPSSSELDAGLSPEQQLAELVAYINSLGLCKTVQCTAVDLSMPLSALNFGALTRQADQVQALRVARRLEGVPLYDTPSHCIRCLFADVLPPLLSNGDAQAPVAPIAVPASPQSSSSSAGSSSPSDATSMLHAGAAGQTHAPHTSSFDATAQGGGHRHGSSASSASASSDPDSQLIQQHINQSAHFKDVRQSVIGQHAKSSSDLPPIQEMESPPPAGCCGKDAACVLQ